ncbi:MAG TPA: SLC13 family permease [Gammaproteobacteria bacterium]
MSVERVPGPSGRVSRVPIGRTHAAIAVCIGAAAALALPAPEGWAEPQFRAALLTLVTITAWATGALPIGVTALLFFLLAMLLGVQPPEVVFSGFAAPAFWLVFGGIVIGVAVRHTGLGERIARASAAAIGGSYLAVLAGVALAATLLAFLMPSSMGRVLTMTPIVLAMAERYGFGPGRPGRAGMVMVATCVAFLPSGAILTALVPNLVLAGAADNLYGVQFGYAEYLLAHFPVMGLLRTVAIVLVARLLFADSPEARPAEPDGPPMTRREIRLAALLAAALALWMTDPWHGVAPAWTALAAAVLLLVPGFDFTPRNALSEKIDYASALYVAAVLGLGAVIAETGLAAKGGAWLTGVLPLSPGADGPNAYVLTVCSAVLGLLVTNPGVPVVLGPLAGELAALSGLPVDTVLMTQVAGFSNVILPYQASPVLVGIALGGVSLRDGTRMLLWMTAITFVVLLPLELVWWQWIGLL